MKGENISGLLPFKLKISSIKPDSISKPNTKHVLDFQIYIVGQGKRKGRGKEWRQKDTEWAWQQRRIYGT